MVNKDERKAVVLQKPSGTIAIAGNMSVIEQKFYNGFLLVAKESLARDPRQHWFSVSLPTLKSLLNVKDDDKNNSYLKKIIRKMHKIEVEYNLLHKDQYIEGFAHLLDNIEFNDKKRPDEPVVVRFSIPERVRLAMLEKNEIYATLNLVIVKGLRSRYSIILYELARDYEKTGIPNMTIARFRKLFGVEDKYSRVSHLKSRVLDPAVGELNHNRNVEFSIRYELIKRGNTYTHIRFFVSTKDPAMLERKVPEDLLSMVPDQYRIHAYPLIQQFLDRGRDYVERNLRYVVNQRPKNYLAYLSDALKNDYGLVMNVETKLKAEKKREETGKNVRKRQDMDAKKELVLKTSEAIRRMNPKDLEAIRGEALDLVKAKGIMNPELVKATVDIMVNAIVQERLGLVQPEQKQGCV